MKYRVWSSSLPDIKVEASSPEDAVDKARKVNPEYCFVASVNDTPQDRYIKNKVRQISFKLNRVVDADILEFIEGLDNKNGYLKELVRADMERRKSHNS